MSLQCRFYKPSVSGCQGQVEAEFGIVSHSRLSKGLLHCPQRKTFPSDIFERVRSKLDLVRNVARLKSDFYALMWSTFPTFVSM